MSFDLLLDCDLSTVPIYLKRFTQGRRVKGKLQASMKKPEKLVASIQPLNGRDIETLPEGRRPIDTIKIYTKKELYITNSDRNQRADIIAVDGFDYEIFQVQKRRGLDLDHYLCFASRVND